MSVLKYKDPHTGEYKITRTVKVITEGGVAEQLKASGYPDYVTPEVVDMVERVRAVRKKNSIVFIAMSDSHYCADQTEIQNASETNASADQANRATKVLCYLIRPDFVAHLGDIACGHGSTTPDMLKSQIEGFIGYFREARSDLPVFVAIGNHDTGIYYHDAQTDGGNHTLTGKYLYDNFTAWSVSPDTVMMGEENGGYCYRDFPNKKVRVFLLHSCEKLVTTQVNDGTTGAQRVWLANALLDLNSKVDATDWGFIVLSHYPADMGAAMPLSDLLKAYVEGKSHTITDADGTNTTVNFSGKHAAKMFAQFHGHTHNFLTSKLYSGGTQYDAWRLCVPNGQYGRENYYGVVNGVDFAEAETYPKTANSADGTSFVVNVLNPDEQKIYSFCYGAGRDRVVGIGSTVYRAVSLKLSHVTSTNDAASVEDGAAYTTTLTPDIGYLFKDIVVTMGGKDITATAYQNGVVTIAKVTGNVVIEAKAQMQPNFENLVEEYENNTYINSSGVIAAKRGYVSTDYIPVTAGAKTIRIAGDGCSIDPIYTRIASYDANHKVIHVISYQSFNIQHSSGVYYNGKLINEPSTLITLELEKVSNLANGVYLRVCTAGDGKDLIVTVDEEITYG